jgi:hypothetical protein
MRAALVNTPGGTMNGRGTTARSDEHVEVAQLDHEAIEIYWWRLEQLTHAGYSDVRAHELASSDQVDLHLACDLLARGCPERTAFAILS